MDEVKIASKFTNGIVSKILNTAIKKKTGYDVEFQLNDVAVTVSDDGKTHVHLNMDAEIGKGEVMRILKEAGF